jgi:hypothetical protein
MNALYPSPWLGKYQPGEPRDALLQFYFKYILSLDPDAEAIQIIQTHRSHVPELMAQAEAKYQEM